MAVNAELRAQMAAIGQYYTSWNNEYLKLSALSWEERADPTTLSRLNNLSRQVGSMQSQVASIGQKNNDAGPANYDEELNGAVIENTAKLDALQANIASVRAGDNPAANPAPTPPAPTTSEKPLTGPADEDNGQGQANTAGSDALPSAPNSSATGQGGTTGGTSNAAQGADGQATSNAFSFTTDGTVPGKRQKNPLGYFSSYTYQVSLYMITSDAYKAFVDGGRRNIDAFNQATKDNPNVGGAFLVAQSGGINNTTSKRAPGFDFDYGIDNVRITTITNAKTESTSANTTQIDFTVVEPYGFSFLTRLRDATTAVVNYSNSIGKPSSENPTKQFFILGIRFFGYDEAGNPVTGNEVFEGNPLDPNGVGGAVFQTFYDITILNIKFKLDGKATFYQIEANTTSALAGFSNKKGIIKDDTEVTAGTVGEAIRKVFSKMNDQQEQLKAKGDIQYPNNYSVVFLDEGSKEIENATLVSPEDKDKYKLANAPIFNTSQSNDAASITARPDTTQRNFTYNTGSPILTIIDNLIAQSSYLRDALKVVYTTLPEPAKTGGREQNKPNTKKEIQWYHCSAEIVKADWDELTNDWAYQMKYIIQTYKTPVLDSSYANPGTKYYGPHKRYEYWYTGKNTEVLGYEQVLDNTYYNTTLQYTANWATAGDAQTLNTNASEGPTTISKVPGQRTNMPRLGRLGVGMEAQNNYITSLYDPGGYAHAKITIMGDPDFLIQDQTSSQSALYSEFYGIDGFTINPNGGQVFVEIDFKEAIDYDSENGFMRINDRILFWKYPENISKKVKGVSYMVLNVTSTLSNGAFRQVLECTVNDFGDVKNAARPGTELEGPVDTGPAPGDSTATTGSTGLLPDNPNNQTLPAGYDPSRYVPSYIPQPAPGSTAAATAATPAQAGGNALSATAATISAGLNPFVSGMKRLLPTSTGPVVDDDGDG